MKPRKIVRLVGGCMDTRTNKEDFALTPYLFGVYAKVNITRIYGLGLCWGWASFYIGIGFNIPGNCKSFKIHR